ncbi:MAG: glycosyltransferase family 39 protein [Patescibacteria group bacterium]
MKRKIVVYLVSICLIGACVRLYRLTNIPNSVSADEAAFGYNAYSLSITGRDEFGTFLPLTLRSFDDYKNPLFGYALIPTIKLFGLNAWSIRLVSAIAGILLIPFIFLISRILTDNLRISLLAALFGSISPWLIQYSRVAIDMELALFFSLLAVWLFLMAPKKPVLFLAASAAFAASFYTYHSSKVWVPLIFICLLFYVKNINRFVLLALLLLGLALVPYFIQLKTSAVGLRPYAISVFANQEVIIRDAKFIAEDLGKNIIEGKFIHNRRFTALNQAVNGYFSVFNPYIYFGTNQSNHSPLTRLFYLWQIPLFIIGFLVFTRNNKAWWLLGIWIFIGMIPGGLTIFPPYDRRVLLISFPLILFMAFGLHNLVTRITPYPAFLWLFKLFSVTLVTFSVFFYLHHYFVHGINTVVDMWGNGMKEVVSITSSLKNKYQHVYVSLKLNQPLTFFLFYEKYDPQKYLAEGGTIYGGYLENGNKFGNYRFQFIEGDDWQPQNLYVWKTSETQECLRPINTVFMSDGLPLAYIGEYDLLLPECQKWLKNKETRLTL